MRKETKVTAEEIEAARRRLDTLTEWDISILCLLVVGAITCSYLAGESAAMDDYDRAQRLCVIQSHNNEHGHAWYTPTGGVLP